MKIKSKILGISHTGSHYSVVLEDLTDKKVKLPVVISNEVAIEISAIVSGVGEPSLIEKLIQASDIEISEIYIDEINTGIFKVKVTLSNNNHFKTSISEALLIAYSTKCDIYVSEDIMKDSGIMLKEDESVDYSKIEYDDDDGYEELSSLDELKNKLEEAIEDENYELATELRDLIDSREK